VIAPALRDRALHVDGWFSTNILGNSDGKALDDAKSLASKLGTKKTGARSDPRLPGRGSYRHDPLLPPARRRQGGLGQYRSDRLSRPQMQLKLNFLCKDSVLAAPLVIEIARVLGWRRRAARRRAGADEPLLQGAADRRRARAGT
jgi:myo-inositol-1-phosphate synthase